jgi:hypothetical protein
MDGFVEAILELWDEGLTIPTIAAKLGIDEDIVANEVEAPGNYVTDFS